MELKIKKYFTAQNFLLFLIVVMSTRYIPIDTRAGVSPVKVAVMAIMPIVLLSNFKMSKAVIWGFMLLIYQLLSSTIINYASFRISSYLYACMFVITYMVFYNFLRYRQPLHIDYFIKFVKLSIFVCTGVLILQQIFLIMGVRYFPLINMGQILGRGIGSNSLFGEPSVFARAMGVLFYAYLKCNEYKLGYKISLPDLFSKTHRKVLIAFAWSMLTMGSGTAFVCLAILSLYFMRGYGFLFSIPVFLCVYFALSYFEVKQFERVQTIAEATLTGEASEVQEADGSASARIAPMLNTFNIDLFDADSWFGTGMDTRNKFRHTSKIYMGNINDIGLIGYILSTLLVLNCAIRFKSLACIMFFLGVGGGPGNIPYGWGLLMLLTCVKYFYDVYHPKALRK